MILTVLKANGTCFQEGTKYMLTTDNYDQLGFYDLNDSDDVFYTLLDVVADGVEFIIASE